MDVIRLGLVLQEMGEQMSNQSIQDKENLYFCAFIDVDGHLGRFDGSLNALLHLKKKKKSNETNCDHRFFPELGLNSNRFRKGCPFYNFLPFLVLLRDYYFSRDVSPRT